MRAGRERLGLRQWLVVELRHKVAKDSAAQTGLKTQAQTASIGGADRNKPCPCGCGQKAKNCTGERPL